MGETLTCGACPPTVVRGILWVVSVLAPQPCPGFGALGLLRGLLGAGAEASWAERERREEPEESGLSGSFPKSRSVSPQPSSEPPGGVKARRG